MHDWNSGNKDPNNTRQITYHDETLRDGLQSSSAKMLEFEEICLILKSIDKLGIASADIGFPAANEKHCKQLKQVMKYANDINMNVELCVAGRTVINDIVPIIDMSQSLGKSIRAYLFIGSSPIRQYIEKWNRKELVKLTIDAVEYAVKNNLTVTYVTEDTTRSYPDDIKALYLAAVKAGADRVVICDTVGHVTPDGTQEIVRFLRDTLDDADFSQVLIEFHGHMDRGLGIWNSIAAYRAGADRIHGTGMGIGERAGNTPMDLLLVNCKLLGLIDNELSELSNYIRYISEIVGIEVPPNYPIFGTNAFRTASGVHAAAILKAEQLDNNLVDLVYSGVPANWFGIKQAIDLGPLSGKSNIIYNLMKRGLKVDEKIVIQILKRVKNMNQVFKDDEIDELFQEYFLIKRNLH